MNEPDDAAGAEFALREWARHTVLPVPLFVALAEERRALGLPTLERASWRFAPGQLRVSAARWLELCAEERPAAAGAPPPPLVWLKELIQLQPQDTLAAVARKLDALLPGAGRVWQLEGFPRPLLPAGLENAAAAVAQAREELEGPAAGAADPALTDVRRRVLARDAERLNRLALEAAFPGLLAPADQAQLQALHAVIHAAPPTRALGLSGGGIRSATFALGVLQGLAEAKSRDEQGRETRALGMFDYLSTVSGGGYIGGWLSAWLHHAQQAQGAGPEQVFAALAGERPAGPLAPEPPAVVHLRTYSNFLAPKLGLFSADTWTLAATYLRNLLLNWVGYVPLLVALLAVPRLYVAMQETACGPGRALAVAALGFAAGAFGLGYCGLNRPAMLPRLERHGRWWLRHRGQAGFLAFGLAPLGLAAVCLALAWTWMWNGCQAAPLTWEDSWPERLFDCRNGVPTVFRLAAFGAALHLAGWGFAEVFLRRLRGVPGRSDAAEAGQTGAVAARRLNPAGELLGVVLAGALAGALMQAVLRLLTAVPADGLRPLLLAVTAPPAFLAAVTLALTLFVGLLSRRSTDEDREWWARMAAWCLIAAAAWAGFGGAVLFGPLLLKQAPEWLAPMGGVTGVFTLLVSRAAATAGRGEGKSRSPLLELGLLLAAPVFLLVLVAAGSLAVGWPVLWAAGAAALPPLVALLLAAAAAGLALAARARGRIAPGLIWWSAVPVTLAVLALGWAAPAPGGFLALRAWPDYLTIVEDAPCAVVFALVAAGVGVSFLVSTLISLNKFSLHSIYRNRLIRAYLGAARALVTPRGAVRRPHPFTGFDPEDNLRLERLADDDDGRCQRPLHVVNMALNLVAGDNLAWQQRKAETFTANGLFAGNFALGFRRVREYAQVEHLRRGARSRPDPAAPGLSLGTAVAVSGAAASPNQGYHSSPLVALLMTLFNIRLGWWLGNPGFAGQRTYFRSSPIGALLHLIKEGLGLTDNASPYVYLSDGGHFENLGLYEMVLRRARFIVLSDAGCDPECALEDLGNAIRKIRVDLGVEVTLEDFRIRRRPGVDAEFAAGAVHCAVGRIDYAAVDGPQAKPGVIIYFKPALTGDEPKDVANYAAASATFPHETTADQFFSESQFESYRSLGRHTILPLYRDPGLPWERDQCYGLAGAAEELLGRVRHALKRDRL
jgi:hypothetical protein